MACTLNGDMKIDTCSFFSWKYSFSSVGSTTTTRPSAGAIPQNPKTDVQNVKPQNDAPQGKLSYEEQKEQEKRIRKAKKAVEDCEARIVELESAIADMDNQLANRPESADNEFFEKYEATKKQLADELNNWERLTEEAEKMG